MISTPITLPPTAPTRNDPDNFRIRADAFLSWLANTFPDEINQVITDFNATIQNLFVATSTSSVAVGTGSKTFTVAETNLAFGVGMELRIAETTDPTVNYMDGIITAYDKTAKTVTVTVSAAEGSGTIAAWTLTCKPRDFSSRVQTWSTLSGPAAPPLIAYHDGTYWPLASTLADVTASEPGVDVQWGGIGQLLKYEEITSSVAEWSPHPQARWLTVEVVAGGGSGAKYDKYACGGGGGMGIIVTFPVGRLSFPVAVLVGAGGASVGGANKREKGRDGGDSGFGPLVMSGGKGGDGNSSDSITYVFFPGGLRSIDLDPRHRIWSFCMPTLRSSTYSTTTTIFGGGSGGAGPNYYGTSLLHGRGGAGNYTDQAGQNGEDGQWPGGGGGAAMGSYATDKHSGAGANGVVRIWQY